MTQTLIISQEVQNNLFIRWKRYYKPQLNGFKTIGSLIQRTTDEIKRKPKNYLTLAKRLQSIKQWFYRQETLTTSYWIINILPREKVEKHLHKTEKNINFFKCKRCHGEGLINGLHECTTCFGSGYDL